MPFSYVVHIAQSLQNVQNGKNCRENKSLVAAIKIGAENIYCEWFFLQIIQFNWCDEKRHN